MEYANLNQSTLIYLCISGTPNRLDLAMSKLKQNHHKEVKIQKKYIVD